LQQDVLQQIVLQQNVPQQIVLQQNVPQQIVLQQDIPPQDIKKEDVSQQNSNIPGVAVHKTLSLCKFQFVPDVVPIAAPRGEKRTYRQSRLV